MPERLFLTSGYFRSPLLRALLDRVDATEQLDRTVVRLELVIVRVDVLP